MEWQQAGEAFFLGPKCHSAQDLPPSVYRVTEKEDSDGLYLTRVQRNFTFDYKIYGLDSKFIQRVHKTWMSRDFKDKTLGVLLSGVKGSGKTVTAKQICNIIGLPVILVTQDFERLPSFLNDIKQDVIVFIDEYEKIFEKSDATLLSVMDGAMSNGYRRVFLLTTNDNYVNSNMLERPGRIRYKKQYEDLPLDIIMEVVNDRLKHIHHREKTIAFLSTLETITIDIMKAVIDEVNIHDESPDVFEKEFNVEKKAKKCDIYLVTQSKNEDGSMSVPVETLHSKNTSWKHFSIYNKGDRFEGGNIKRVIDRKTADVMMEIFNEDGTSVNQMKTFRLRKSDSQHESFAVQMFDPNNDDADFESE